MMQAARGDLKGLMPLEPLVLEVNPHHNLLVKLNEMKTAKPLLAQCVTEQLYDDCLVSAGLLDDPRTMIPRLNSILMAALGGEFTLPPGGGVDQERVQGGSEGGVGFGVDGEEGGSEVQLMYKRLVCLL